MTFNGLGFVLIASMLTACQPAASPVPPASTSTRSALASATSSSTSAPSPSAIPPTGTATPVPAPRIFKEEFAEASPYWDILQVDTGQAPAPPEVNSGFLVFDLPAPNQWVFALYRPFAYADVRIDADVQTRSGPAGIPGLICRYDKDGGWYEFDIHQDQTYVLLYGRWLADGIASYTPLVRAQSEKILPDENEIGLLCEGDTLTPYINGTQLRRQQEKNFGLTSGKIGVTAASFEDGPATVAYDWVQAAMP